MISIVPKLSQGDENDSEWVIVKVRLAQTEAKLTGDTVVVSLSGPISEEREREEDYKESTAEGIDGCLLLFLGGGGGGV